MLELLSRARSINAGAITAVSCMRNESSRLPYFLDYYRQLGVGHFVIVDNSSDDGSPETLAQQPDVTLYLAKGRYSDSNCGVDWLNEALDAHCQGLWAIVVDADELLIYPDVESRSLKALADYLDGDGSDALATFMLDMYSCKPIREVHYQPRTPFLDACRFFDGSGYERGTSGHYAGLPVRGGPRKRLFWAEKQGQGQPPFLGKTPLVKWSQNLRFEASTHTIQGLRRARLTGALLHFKLFSDFAEVAQREAARGEHWQGGAQYRSYHERMRLEPALSAYCANSVEYKNSSQLVDLELLRTVPDWWDPDSDQRERP